MAAAIAVAIAAPAGSAQTVNVSPNTGHIAVCRGIYGANFPDSNPTLANELGIPHARWGGNRATRYHYANHTSCSGSDYGEDANGSSCSPVNGSTCFESCEGWLGTHENFVQGNAGRGMVASVPSNRFDKTAAAGARLKNTLSNVPSGSKCRHELNGADCDQEYGQGVFDGFVADLLRLGIREFEIDNEPVLWPDTHRPATPALQPTNNADFIQMEKEAAQRIGDVAAGAPYGLSPGSYKIWAGAFYSGWDLTGGFAQKNFPACTDSTCFTFNLMRELCDTPATGISFHWYPEIYAGGCRIESNNPGCGDTQALEWGRVNASRELWQPGFQASNGSLGVQSSYDRPRVISWLKDVNARACPAKRFEYAITEWRVGNEATRSSWSVGLGTVDFLAGMGHAGVTEAHLWMDLRNGNAQQAMYRAFQLFLSPDGSTASAVGGDDGGIMVDTDRVADESLRAYAYKSSDGAHLWVLLLNLDWASNTKNVTVQLRDGVTASGTATVYGINRDGSVQMAGSQTTLPVSGSSFGLQVPGGARLVYLPTVSGAAAVAHDACGPIAGSNPAPAPNPTPSWSARASHTPDAPTAADAVTSSGIVQHSYATAQTVTIQTMVKDATSGAEVGHTNCPAVAVQPNTPYACNDTRTLPAGSYKIEVGVFSTDWTTLLHWKSDADFFTVSAASGAPAVQSGNIGVGSSCAGQPVPVSGTVRAGVPGATYNVQLMLKDAAGASGGVFNCTNLALAAAQTYACSGSIVPRATGPLSLSVGIFNAMFNQVLDWRDALDSTAVQSCGPTVRYGFEDSAEGWTVNSGRVAIFQAYSGNVTFGHGGAYALRTQSIDSSTVQVVDKETGPLPSVGDTVSFYLASANPACIAYMQPFVQDGADGGWAWIGTYVAGSDLPNVQNDQWLKVDVPVSRGIGEMWRIGVEMKLAPGCSYTSTYVDDVSW